MKVMLDLNVLLDVVQRREPHFAASATVCGMAIRKEVTGFIPVHAVTTLSYIVRKHAGAKKEAEVLDWLLTGFKVARAGHEELLRARLLGMADFEDAVLAATAKSEQCRFILSRNVVDFRNSPVPAVTPEEFLATEFTHE